MLIADPENEKYFSAASLWELAIKVSSRPDIMRIDLEAFERGLLDHNYRELPITSRAGRETAKLPLIHKDPFDRLLIAQATVEDLTLLTADATIARYGGRVQLV